MATEERLVRLENAFTTLAELASDHQERISSLEESSQMLAELARRADERVSSLERSFEMLVQLARSADERLDQHLAWVNQLGEAQANTEVKMAALTDAQIRTDEALTKLAEAQAKSAEAQAHSDQRLDALIDIVREWRNGKS